MGLSGVRTMIDPEQLHAWAIMLACATAAFGLGFYALLLAALVGMQ